MKKNKGFTLIELLAIIVILAIIAVITVPIILNIIENSRKGAAQDSAYGFKDSVDKWYVSELSKSNNGNFSLATSYTVTDGKLNGSIEIPVSGEKPSSGYLNYSNNILTSGCLVFGDYAVTFNGNETSTAKGECGALTCGANQHVGTVTEYYVADNDIGACAERMRGEFGSTEEEITAFCSGQTSFVDNAGEYNFSEYITIAEKMGADLANVGFPIQSRNVQACVDNESVSYYTYPSEMNGVSSMPFLPNYWGFYIKETTNVLTNAVTNQLCIVKENDTICLNANDTTNSVAALSDYSCSEYNGNYSCSINTGYKLNIFADTSIQYQDEVEYYVNQETGEEINYTHFCRLNADGTAECVG